MSSFDKIIRQVNAALEVLETSVPKTFDQKQCYLTVHPTSARREFLNTLEQQHTRVRKRVLKVHRLWKKLESIEQTLMAEADQVVGCVLPVYCLPDEILRMIFSWAIIPDMTWINQVPAAESAANLAKVCHQWRDVAYAYSELWTTISTTLPELHYIASVLPRSLG
ncbi:hypothetical protein DL93DRAFT_920622 [Clavulina sp. PMI_390]|nr:hypothetical protein DL93DRAFT_920622 [Clavulina sp. PMI_390]